MPHITHCLGAGKDRDTLTEIWDIQQAFPETHMLSEASKASP